MVPQGYDIYAGFGSTLEMPFDGWLWTFYAANAGRSFWFHGAPSSCVSSVLIDPPRPAGVTDFDAGQLYCKANGFAGSPAETRLSGLITASAMPENSLPAAGPVEPCTNQPYTYSSPAPTPPPQTTVEQAIETELAKPENSVLRQWLNYELGSPGETDPLGIGPPNASQETLDRTAQLLDSQDTQEKKATGTGTIRNCRVPLWHYTSSANAPSIYASKAIRASDEAGVGAPQGAYASTVTPLDPGPPGDPWTQVSLAYHLFAQLRPVDGWVFYAAPITPTSSRSAAWRLPTTGTRAARLARTCPSPERPGSGILAPISTPTPS